MSSGDGGKQYGLILPSKNKAQVQAQNVRKLNPLLDSDDELEQDEESPLNWVEASLKKSAGNSGQQALQRRMLREAVAEDASVFQYDEVYDDIQASKTAEVVAKKDSIEKKPKYIHNILKHAEKRKLESERRKERQVQKEREEEGEEFADKEAFVTASYLKKMEELKEAEQKAKLEELQEESIDVMKHKNFGVFYNHLFKQRMGDSVVKTEPDDPVIKKEPQSDGEGDHGGSETIRQRDKKRQKHYRTQRDLSESPEREVKEQKRARKGGQASSDSEEEEKEKVESYRDRRDRLKEERRDRADNRPRGRSTSRERRRERSVSYERRRDRSRSRERRRERSHSRERRREGSHSRERRRDTERSWGRGRGFDRARDRRSGREGSQDRDRGHRGRHRSGSRDRHGRSRSPQRRRADNRRSRSPQRRSGSREKIKIKEEPKSPDNNRKENGRNKGKSEDIEDGKANGKMPKEGGAKVKKESQVDDKEKRMERIKKLFEKRTIGDKFDLAVQKYYQRKAARESQG